MPPSLPAYARSMRGSYIVPSLLDSVFSSAACLLLYLITVFSAEFGQASAFEVSLSTLVSQDSVLWDTCRQQMSRADQCEEVS